MSCVYVRVYGCPDGSMEGSRTPTSPSVGMTKNRWRPSSDNSGMCHTALLTCLIFWVSSSVFDNIPSFMSVEFAGRKKDNFGTITRILCTDCH
jgi:hypothetical protein